MNTNNEENVNNQNVNNQNAMFNLELRGDNENMSLSPTTTLDSSENINTDTIINENQSDNQSDNQSENNYYGRCSNSTPYRYNYENNINRNNRNNRNNHYSSGRCSECNFVDRNNYINTDRLRNIHRDRYNYGDIYRDLERERQQERTMLNQIYNELLHQNNLLQSMRIDISNIWNRIRTNDEYSRSRYHHNRNNTTNNSRQNGSSNPRININGIPYILENIQHFNAFPRTTPNATTSANFIDSFMNLMDFQSNVPIIPTREQILNATREIQFGQIENPINTTCPISLESFQETDTITQILYCGHNFNTRQLNTWFHSNVRCPMCRYDIRDYNNDLDVHLETPMPTMPTTEALDISNNNTYNSERRTRFSQRQPFESSINNIATNLSTIAMDTINELFDINNNNFEENGDSRFMFDPSNNILLFETIVNNGNRFRYRNNNSNNQNSDPRNIV